MFSESRLKSGVRVHTRHSQKPSHKRRQSLEELHSINSSSKLHALRRDISDRTRTVSLSGGRSWYPDRKTIDAQLNEMKKRVSMDVSALD